MTSTDYPAGPCSGIVQCPSSVAPTTFRSDSDFELTGGFWVIPECPAIPCDYDGDCDDRDFDTDGDIDQADFAFFQRCFSGPDVPADPNCAE